MATLRAVLHGREKSSGFFNEEGMSNEQKRKRSNGRKRCEQHCKGFVSDFCFGESARR
jgi:hypothetical protein